MRPDVNHLLDLGRVPRQTDPEAYCEAFRERLLRIARPVSVEEARALLGLFNPEEEEDGGGMAWTLLHLMESSGYEVPEPTAADGAWHHRLHETRGRSGATAVVSDALVQDVRSRETFDLFLRAFVEEATAHGMTWENREAPQFVAALSAWLDDSAGFYRNMGLDPVDVSPWRLLADGLMAARSYE